MPHAATDRRPPSRERLLALLASVVVLLAAPARGAEPADEPTRAQLEFFEASIRPLLLQACGECHGEQYQWGGLRLDTRAAIERGGDSGAIVVAGQPDASRLIAAVRRQGDLAMPPDEELSAEQILLLERWIRDGAHWPVQTEPLVDPNTAAERHWAYQPLDTHSPPASDEAWCQTPIDAFVLAKLSERGLRPAPQADRRTLIRRVSYDLTGLPPTPEEVESFVHDSAPDAYARLVDRLLASPQYGEHWGRHWLDVARYSDTKGYVYGREERFFVQAPAYRDWVVQAFRDDLPYDQFLLLQLAADQVAPERVADWAAMGFLTVGRRFLGVTHDIIDDRIDVVTRGTMGLTVSCARCHDHKYDPIPTADYYSLYGVFQNCTERLVQVGEPDERDEAYEAFEAELEQRRAALEVKRQESRATAARRVRERVTDYLAAQLEWEKYPEENFDQILSPDDLIPAFVRRWHGYLAEAAERGDPVFAPWHRFAALPAEGFAAAASEVAAELERASQHEVNRLVIEALATPPSSMNEVAQRYGHLFGEIERELSEREAAGDEVARTRAFDDPDAEALRLVLYGAGSPCLVPDEPIVTTESYFDTGTVTELWRLQGEVDRWLIRSPQAPPFAVAVVDRDWLTEPRVFRRGNPARRGEAVARQFLELIEGNQRRPFSQGSGRLELARAIVHPDNPLTARVWVNRVWMHHFGAGLVTTPSDFGLRSAVPSHPELLDWLARWFIDEGWSTKQLHRLILRSATYQQQSAFTDGEASARAAELDPENRLLWRMNPRRLSFEEFRDTLLALAGDLDQQMGGRATDLFDASNRRRTLYGLIDRQFLPGVLRAFDFANPDMHSPQRNETTVPQQALFAMNHPFVAARARSLASRVDSDDSAQRVDALYRRIFQRPPTASQRQAALAYVTAADDDESPEISPQSMAWQYGYATIDPELQTLGEFQSLPYFTGTAWRGGPEWPDMKLGWLQLTADGGHPGNDWQHAVVRRWTAPRAATVRVASIVAHEPASGDGIRCWVFSSRQGLLKVLAVHQREEAIDVDALAVEAGDTLDFVVDIHGNLNSDQFLWAPAIEEIAEQGGEVWDAQRDFRGPIESLLNPWEQLVQVLLLSNELMFVD